MSVKTRLPRPFGITQAMAEYHKNPLPETRSTITAYLIQQWIIFNGRVCGRSFNALQLADFLGCDPEIIRIQMRDQFLATKLWDRDKQEELINSLIGQQVIWAMEDRMEVENQLDILKRSQGDKYTPFITSELNKVIGMKMTSTQGMSSILKSLSGGGSINIFNNNQQQTNNGISMDQALELIQRENAQIAETVEKEQNQLYGHEIKYIEATHNDLSDIPEVVATEQRGVDVSKEGLGLSQSELNQIADNYKGAIAAFDGDHHEMRREIEMQIDPDEEDPEIDNLPI